LKKGKVDFKLIKRMIAFSAPIIANDLSWWLIHSTDKIMVEYMVGASALGLYTVATKIPALINVIISIFLQAWGIATIAENESTNDQRFYSNVFKIYSFIAFGASVFLTAIIKLFMSIYVGFEFIDSWRYIPLLLVSASFSAISSYYGSLYGAFKRNISSMVTTIIGAIANLILNYVFIRIYGIWGAIIGTIVAYIIISTFRMIDTRKFVKFEINFARYLFNGFIVLVQAILVSLNWNIYIVSAIAIVLFVTINIDSIKLFISMLRSKLKQNNRVEEE
jgi:O-antigen/teichoic acid export membrane protein